MGVVGVGTVGIHLTDMGPCLRRGDGLGRAVIASVAKQSRASWSDPGLLRYARNDEGA